jgi:hypothetical protein
MLASSAKEDEVNVYLDLLDAGELLARLDETRLE